MRLFYLGWRIPQTLSAESHPAKSLLGGSERSPDPYSGLCRPVPARRILLPWLHYVPLMTVKSEQARAVSTRPRPCGVGGACASWTGRSAPSSTSGRHSPATRPRRLRKGSEARSEDAVSPKEEINDAFVWSS